MLAATMQACNAGAKMATECVKTTFHVLYEAKLGHVVSGVSCTNQKPNSHMAVTKVFIKMHVEDFVIS